MAYLIPSVCHVWRLLCALPLIQRVVRFVSQAPPRGMSNEAARPPVGFLRARGPHPQERSRPCHKAHSQP
jgi:hypothetical protein